MLKINELRIGNWILVRGEPIQVDENDFVPIKEHTLVPEPVPLSLEILKNAGFKNVRGWANDLYYNGHFTIMARFNKFQIAGVKYEVRYIHELQNIHFAFSKEELNINVD